MDTKKSSYFGIIFGVIIIIATLSFYFYISKIDSDTRWEWFGTDGAFITLGAVMVIYWTINLIKSKTKISNLKQPIKDGKEKQNSR